MHPKTPSDLWELHRSTTYLLEKTRGLSVADLEADFDLQLIVERQLERIGETLRRVSERDPAIAARIPGIRQAINQRNMIAHEYYELEWDRIHWTLNNSVSRLQDTVNQLIADHPEEMKL